MMNASLPIRVHVGWLMKGVGVIGTVAFLAATIFSWNDPTGGPVVGALFLVFAGLSAYVLVSTFSTVEADAEGVTVNAVHSVYRINWWEIQLIESNGVAFVLSGGDKQLAFNLTYAGMGKTELIQFLVQQAKDRRIEVKPLIFPFAGQKNTKIS